MKEHKLKLMNNRNININIDNDKPIDEQEKILIHDLEKAIGDCYNNYIQSCWNNKVMPEHQKEFLKQFYDERTEP